jgi:hypothetical protein
VSAASVLTDKAASVKVGIPVLFKALGASRSGTDAHLPAR